MPTSGKVDDKHRLGDARELHGPRWAAQHRAKAAFQFLAPLRGHSGAGGQPPAPRPGEPLLGDGDAVVGEQRPGLLAFHPVAYRLRDVGAGIRLLAEPVGDVIRQVHRHTLAHNFDPTSS